MAKLSAAQRHAMSKKNFALSGERFPLNDATHDREAISGATRSYNAGNISKSQENEVKAKARAKLNHGRQKSVIHKAILGHKK